MSIFWIFALSVCLLQVVSSIKPGEYDPDYGTYVGLMKELHHDVTGEVYAVDNITIYIKSFSYDGEAPDAFFFAGNKTPEPTNRGFIIPDDKGRNEVLGPYRRKNLILNFPITKKGQRSFYDIMWISVWCKQFAIDFGHVKLPKGLVTPDMYYAPGLKSEIVPGLSSANVVLGDTKTIYLTDFTFDGSLEDAIFVMGSGDAKAAGVQVPNEKGSLDPLSKYKKKTIKLTKPEDTQGETVQYFGVWSPTKGMLASVTFPLDARIPPALSLLPSST